MYVGNKFGYIFSLVNLPHVDLIIKPPERTEKVSHNLQENLDASFSSF